MRGSLEKGLVAAAMVLALIDLGGATGWRFLLAPSGGKERGSRYYHEGKSLKAPSPDPKCQSAGCHGVDPHGKDITVSAFLNMHAGYAECLSCHGKDAVSHWEGKDAGDGKKWKVRYASKEGIGPHALKGPPVGCRGCHSENGRDALRAKGVKDLGGSFAAPIVLRMIEEGGKRWVPQDIR